jgi:hypothetical protein
MGLKMPNVNEIRKKFPSQGLLKYAEICMKIWPSRQVILKVQVSARMLLSVRNKQNGKKVPEGHTIYQNGTKNTKCQ